MTRLPVLSCCLFCLLIVRCAASCRSERGCAPAAAAALISGIVVAVPTTDLLQAAGCSAPGKCPCPRPQSVFVVRSAMSVVHERAGAWTDGKARVGGSGMGVRGGVTAGAVYSGIVCFGIFELGGRAGRRVGRQAITVGYAITGEVKEIVIDILGARNRVYNMT
jgi:hypothetical protein